MKRVNKRGSLVKIKHEKAKPAASVSSITYEKITARRSGRSGLKLIGGAPQVELTDGSRIVFEHDARMYGRPDGSVQIVGKWRRVTRPRRLRPGEFVWDNPPGERQGVTFGARTGEVRIAPDGFVNPTQAARLLSKSKVWVYQLIKSRRLRAVKRGTALTAIPLTEIKRMLGFNRPQGPWLVG